MRSAEPALRVRHAVALGLLQGPTELLPVSSSAHTALVPLLAGWPYAELGAEQRKSFEVSLHAAAAIALALALPGELGLSVRGGKGAGALALSLAPPAIAGLALRGQIERRLGGPRATAAGLIAGALAMAAADLRGGARRCEDARPADALAIGIAQALALIPGVSRSGATLTAGRARGFTRAGARRLSWAAALPVMLGAGAFEVARARAGRPSRAVALASLASFLSTLASVRVLRAGALTERSLLPFAAYRIALGALVLRHGSRRSQ